MKQPKATARDRARSQSVASVSLSTFIKWQAQLERELQTMTWLRCDTDTSNPAVVDTLWCHACRTKEAKIIGMNNYSGVWISGSTNHKNSCVIDHANSDQYRAAMNHMKKGAPLVLLSQNIHLLLVVFSTWTIQRRIVLTRSLISAMSWVKSAWLLRNTLLSTNWKAWCGLWIVLQDQQFCQRIQPLHS